MFFEIGVGPDDEELLPEEIDAGDEEMDGLLAEEVALEARVYRMALI